MVLSLCAALNLDRIDNPRWCEAPAKFLVCILTYTITLVYPTPVLFWNIHFHRCLPSRTVFERTDLTPKHFALRSCTIPCVIGSGGFQTLTNDCSNLDPSYNGTWFCSKVSVRMKYGAIIWKYISVICIQFLYVNMIILSYMYII